MNNRAKIAVLLIFAAIFIDSAQTIAAAVVGNNDRRMLADGKIWECNEYNLVDELRFFQSEYTVSGDTIIGDIACKKCFLRSERLKQETPQFVCGLMEDGSRVYTVNEDGMTLLCDFGLQVGERITVSESGIDYVAEVIAVDYVNGSNGLIRRQTVMVKMLQTDDQMIVSWIEGVGPSSSPLCTPGRLFLTSSYSEEVIRCIEDGECIFTTQTTGLETYSINVVLSSASTTLSACYDLQGRRLQQRPHQGVYIENGRKQVVK